MSSIVWVRLRGWSWGLRARGDLRCNRTMTAGLYYDLEDGLSVLHLDEIVKLAAPAVGADVLKFQAIDAMHVQFQQLIYRSLLQRPLAILASQHPRSSPPKVVG